MDELAQLSRENFEVFQRYGDAIGPHPHLHPRHRTIAIHGTAAPGAPTTYVEKDLIPNHLPKFFTTQSCNGSSATATMSPALKLVIIDSRLESWSNFSSSLWVTKDVFMRLVDAMCMNPAALWLLRSEYDGFHYFSSSADNEAAEDVYNGSGGGGRGDADTYYIGTANFVVIWTFSQQAQQTRALWILRQQHNPDSGDDDDNNNNNNSAPVA